MSILELLLLALSPFTVLGMWDRRKQILAKLNELTKPKKVDAKEPEAKA